MSYFVYSLIGLAAGVCFILALKGLSTPKTARRGNMIGAIGATIATVVVFFYSKDGESLPLNNLGWILGAIAVGVVIGVPAARKVQMTQMPQLVALFNGVGGGAAALVAIVEYLNLGETASTPVVIATVFTVIVGCVSFSGSIITFLKLQELMTTRPVVFPGGRFVIAGTLATTLAAAVWVVIELGTNPLLILAALSLLFGVLFVLPVGGADVPIVISLLNAFTGLTVAASGYVLDSTLLIIAGTLVGASGTILTRLMAEAMGRSLFGTLFGAFTAKPQEASGAAEDRPVRSGSPDDVAILLNYARRVVIMEEVNPTFGQTDVAIVIGANDVVNPAAQTTPGCPIYGMPILEVANAANIIFLKRSMRPGFAGIENELLFDPKTMLLFGDAKASLTKVVSALKNL